MIRVFIEIEREGMFDPFSVLARSTKRYKVDRGTLGIMMSEYYFLEC
jgi:hypothetical protein